MSEQKRSILFLADLTHPATAVHDHIQAIVTCDRFTWYVINPLIYKTLDLIDLSRFDAVGLHYSVKPYNQYYISYLFKKKLAQFCGVKFLFLQDEYQKVNIAQDFLAFIDFDLFFTLVAEKYWKVAYPDPRLSRMTLVNVLTGYVPDVLLAFKAPPVAARSIDVSYRARRCEFWLGKLAYEKQMIGDQFVQRTKNTNLNLDISLEEADRCYGQSWFDLLSRSKAVLGSESGASIWDFDGMIQRETIRYCREHKNAFFDQVFTDVLKPYDGRITYSAISPRVFEAAATKTAMIMFPGDYSGICEPDKHYIVLKKDFSNLPDVLSKLRDPDYLQALVDRTYQDLIASKSYSQHAFADLVSAALLKKFQEKKFETSSYQGDLDNMLTRTMKQHLVRNAYRRMRSEAVFIVRNFIEMLTDPRYSMLDRLALLRRGMLRYFAYLLPRLKIK